MHLSVFQVNQRLTSSLVYTKSQHFNKIPMKSSSYGIYVTKSTLKWIINT
jgi:hypothetical protein